MVTRDTSYLAIVLFLDEALQMKPLILLLGEYLFSVYLCIRIQKCTAAKENKINNVFKAHYYLNIHNVKLQ